METQNDIKQVNNDNAISIKESKLSNNEIIESVVNNNTDENNSEYNDNKISEIKIDIIKNESHNQHYPFKYTPARIIIYIIVLLIIFCLIVDFFKVMVNFDDYFYGMLYPIPITKEPLLNVIYKSIKESSLGEKKQSLINGITNLDYDSYYELIECTHTGKLSTKVFHYIIIIFYSISVSIIINSLIYNLTER